DVDIEVSEGKLAVTGRGARRTESDKDGVYVREIRSGEFRREFTLPRGVTAERVSADYDKGLLTIRVSEVVAQPAEPARIKVRQPAAELTATPEADARPTE
ncbi:MAG TPA: Hsp20/alpha crystallin family protein, partial [Pseudonocardiaceae bacterium]|nr:Hsp20/alpha crystallin family protein [Pseudonocardiaceae bacterium]